MDHDSARGNGGWLDRMLEAIRRSARHRSVEAQIARLHAAQEAQAAAIGLLGDWQRSATAHLTGLQAGHDALASHVASLFGTAPPPVIEWIRTAEAHLRALQAETERLHSLVQQHEHGLASLRAGLSQVEHRAIDLEHADTEIALGLAREPGSRTLR